MAISESTFKASMTAKLRANEDCYARRFEDQFAVGIPDVIIIPMEGPVFFVEVKVIRAGEAWGPSPRQLEELRRIARTNHAIPVMMGWRLHDDTVHLDFPAQKLKMPGVVVFPRSDKHYVSHLLAYASKYRRKLQPLTDVASRGTVEVGGDHG